jgi:preprotein translocase subunit SecD
VTPTTKALTPAQQAARDAVGSCDANPVASLGAAAPTTGRDEEQAGACVVLPGNGSKGDRGRYYLGPTALTGKAVDSASRQFQTGSGYSVQMKLTSKGSGAWDQLGSQQFHQQVAIELDGVVESAPTIQPNNNSFESFGGTAIISGQFTPSEAADLAKLINYGALPVRLNQSTATSVSPTLGRDQLHAGIIAGIIGLVLVALYMLLYYRLLGLVVIVGLGLSGAALYSLISYLAQTVSLTLTLAGVTGIIVSVGVTVDSYIVYYERLKDEARAGRTIRSSVDRGFVRSFRTILAADLVSLLGAVILYFLAIGSVRGFAFFLGMSTLLDLIVAYCFMHPLVSILARRTELVRMRGFGIAAGLDAPGVVA